jgi:hypothetical protein
VIGTPSTGRIVRNCAPVIFDVDGLQSAGDLLARREETMSTFMVDGMPDATCSRRATEALRVCRGRTDCTVRAYGDGRSAVKDGHSVAAVRLEMLWNKLAMTRLRFWRIRHGGFYWTRASTRSASGFYTWSAQMASRTVERETDRRTKRGRHRGRSAAKRILSGSRRALLRIGNRLRTGPSNPIAVRLSTIKAHV